MAKYSFTIVTEVYDASIDSLSEEQVEGVLLKTQTQQNGEILLGISDSRGRIQFSYPEISITNLSFKRLGFNEVTRTIAYSNTENYVWLTSNGEVATNYRCSVMFTDFFNYLPQSNKIENLTESMMSSGISSNFVKYTYPGHPLTSDENRFLRLSDIFRHTTASTPEPIVIIPDSDLPYVFFFRCGVKYPVGNYKHHLFIDQLRVDETNNSLVPQNQLVSDNDFSGNAMYHIYSNNVNVNSNWAYVFGELSNNFVHFWNNYTYRSLAPINGFQNIPPNVDGSDPNYLINHGYQLTRIDSGAVVSFRGTLSDYSSACSSYGKTFLETPFSSYDNFDYDENAYDSNYQIFNPDNPIYTQNSINVGVFNAHLYREFSYNNMAVGASYGYCMSILRVQINNLDDLDDIGFVQHGYVGYGAIVSN